MKPFSIKIPVQSESANWGKEMRIFPYSFCTPITFSAFSMLCIDYNYHRLCMIKFQNSYLESPNTFYTFDAIKIPFFFFVP